MTPLLAQMKRTTMMTRRREPVSVMEVMRARKISLILGKRVAVRKGRRALRMERILRCLALVPEIGGEGWWWW